jgi:hypothetical protein
MTLVTFSLGATLAVFVVGSASAASSKRTTTSKAAASKYTTMPGTTKSPADRFFVINGTVNAASDHEIVGSSAFPNFTKGAVDNYYAMAHSHVDNSPFAEGTASPADTGPIGQTVAAGHFPQPQYADARWPGKPDTETYGSQGRPYATAAAGKYRATAEASEASNGLSGPGPSGSMTLPVPKGFDDQLRQALAAWKATWQDRLAPKNPTPTVTTPIATVTVPKAGVTTPTPTVTTPIATVTTPHATGGSVNPTPPPPPTVPSPTLPSPSARGASRSLASASTSQSPTSASTSGDGESLLTSSTLATLVPKTNTTKTGTTKTAKSKTYALVTSGESSLGRVSLGGGQIVIEGIHVTASIANDGTPTYKADVSVGSASIGGIPVTIDQDGVHVAGQGHGLPYQQASDALNGALNHAGIKLFLVAPEICDQTGSSSSSGSGSGSGTTTTTTTTTTTSSDQSGSSNTSNSCDQSGASATCNQSGSAPAPPPLPGQSDTGSCDQTRTSGTCDQTGTTTTGTTTTTAGTTTTTKSKSTPTPTPAPTALGGQSDTTTTASSCGNSSGTTMPSSCAQTGAAIGTTPTSSDAMGLNTGNSNAGEETVRATGLHVVFTQPVSQGGVPAQFVEHILGEVFLDSLAVPAGQLPKLDLSSSSSSSLSSSSSSSSSSCLGGGGGTTSGGGSSFGGGSTSSPSGSTFGSTSQPGSSSTANSLPAAFASALRKPLWLLLAYVLWQALVIATGWSLWNWRRGGAS